MLNDGLLNGDGGSTLPNGGAQPLQTRRPARQKGPQGKGQTETGEQEGCVCVHACLCRPNA